MSGFNEESQMPDATTGGDETAVKTVEDTTDHEPSVQSTDRYGLQKLGKGYLLRKYNIAISKVKQPYFEPIASLLNEFVADAPAVLTEARARLLGSADARKRVEKLVKPARAYFAKLTEYVGEDRAWLARSLIIWPLTDQVGFQMYKAASGEADLLDYATYLIRTDANVNNLNDLSGHAQYETRMGWTDLAYMELGEIDFLISEIDPDSIEYNLTAILRSGYQSAANLDTRKHLRGNNGEAPLTDDTVTLDIKSQLLASRRLASQVT